MNDRIIKFSSVILVIALLACRGTTSVPKAEESVTTLAATAPATSAPEFETDSQKITIQTSTFVPTLELTETSTPTILPFPITGERIAFVSRRDGDPEVYLMKPDGSMQTKLTNLKPRSIKELIWSPEGEQLALVVEQRGIDWNIYVMNHDGTALTQLMTAEDELGSLTWSPDGSMLAFEMKGVGLWADIYVLNVSDGSFARNVTNANFDDKHPAWSPGGKYIAFASSRDPSFDFPTSEIYLMDADGGNPVSVTDHSYFAHDVAPVWSPDGTMLAFVSDRTDDNELYVVDFNAGSYKRISEVLANRAWPIQYSWSPDGKLIAFAANVEFQYDIFVINTDGSGGAVRLTKDPEDDLNPAWSPDGRHILFVSERNGDRDIYVMNVDGGDVRRLTSDGTFDLITAWSP